MRIHISHVTNRSYSARVCVLRCRGHEVQQMKTTITEIGRGDNAPNEPADGLISRTLFDLVIDLTLLESGVERLKIQVHALTKPQPAAVV